MKYNLALFLIIGITISISAQTVANFENLGVYPDEFLNGNDLSGGFESGHVFLANDFNESYQSWLGWAISAMTDTQTPGFNNQYSSIPGEGAEGSTTYAVNFSYGANNIRLTQEAQGDIVNGLYITNSTYAYLSMRDGDAFAKRFGGETGDDPDFFKLTIKKYSDGQLGADSVDFFLADYRFEDNTQDYLVDKWMWVDLTELGSCDSLWMNLSSSDNGQFGMNTPSFFCIDNVTTEDVSTAVSTINLEPAFKLYPNPASHVLYIDWDQSEAQMQLVDGRGVVIYHHKLDKGIHEVDLSWVLPGVYFVSVTGRNEVQVRKVVVE